MVHIEHFTFNAFQTCCSLVWDDIGFCAVVDPGCFSTSEKEELTSFISKKGLRPVCIMLTHGHFDHIYGLADLIKTYNIPVYMDMKETYSFEHTNPYVCGSYGLPLAEIPAQECFRNVSEGDVIYVEKLDVEAGAEVSFDKVLLIGEGSDVKVGAPLVDGVSVAAKVIKNDKAKKVVVYKYKPKKGYHKKQGHRQPYTKVEITKING